MKYIKTDARGFMTYDAYFEYLETIRDKLGENLYLFASDPERHNLSSHRSLHDAWIKSLTVKTSYGSPGSESTDGDVDLVLLGPYHDRILTLNYSGVRACNVDFQFCQNGRKRDLLYHELRHENGIVEHELVFDGDMSIEIFCTGLICTEQLLNDTPA